jgi:carbon monoxide dehydrogenase subunit G
MYKFESSTFINRPPQEVFDYVTNPANYAKWSSGIQSAEWTSDGPPGVGSTVKGVAKFLGRKIEFVTEITGWDPPNLWRVKSVGGPIPFESTSKFEAQGDGTLLTETFQGELGGFFKLAEGLVGKQFEKQIEAERAALKLLLESGQV